MIEYIKGNLLDSPAQALVNTVNTVGVMGKGIALQFKEAFPNNFKAYREACKDGSLLPGKLLVVRENTVVKSKIIINFPTKTEWYKKSQYKFIEDGLDDLAKIIPAYNINSIAIPPLGCGNGGLKWDKVKELMERKLSSLIDVQIWIYEPNEKVKDILKNQDSKKKAKLTTAKAMLLYSLFFYESMGENCSLFVANKLAYFLQRLGEKSLKRIKFQAYHYGPYSPQVAHTLHGVNGVFIKGLEQLNTKAFEPLELQYDKAQEVSDYVKRSLSFEQREHLKNLIQLIRGFQSTYSLEVLATVDFIRKKHPQTKPNEIRDKVWSDRKKDLFQEKHIRIAYDHLNNYASKIMVT